MRRFLPIVVLIIVCLLYTKPYFRSGFFPTHDGEWAIVRLAEMQRELKDGQIPPRWADYLNHGYGYPLFSFTYPAPFYIGTVLRLFKISLVDTVKIIFVGSVVCSAIFMFLLGRELAGDYAGFLSALFYIVAPFRLVDLYVRGSIGESVSLALFPMLFYLSFKYILKPTSTKMALCSIILALLILSHNIMAIIFFPLLIIFLYVTLIAFFEDMKLYSWRYFLPMIALGLGLSAYFFLPALLEKQYIVLSKIKLSDLSLNFIKLPEYLLSPWSYDKPSYQLGWAHILSAIVGLVAVFMAKGIAKAKYLPYGIFIIASIFTLIFFTHPYSAEFWNIPPLSWIDFPWRLLTPLAFFLALATMFLSIYKPTRIIGGILVIITVLLSINFAHPKEYSDKLDSYYATNDATTTSQDELMPIWVNDRPKERYGSGKVELEDRGAIYNLEYKSNSVKFRVVTNEPNKIKVNTVYFPGWKFYARGEEVSLDFRNPDGLIRFNVPAGNTSVEGRFTETPVRLIANIISILSLTISIVLLLYPGLAFLRNKFSKK